MMRLTKSELEIMEVLWAADEPLCRADIIARSQDKTWKDSSVHILLVTCSTGKTVPNCPGCLLAW